MGENKTLRIDTFSQDSKYHGIVFGFQYTSAGSSTLTVDWFLFSKSETELYVSPYFSDISLAANQSIVSKSINNDNSISINLQAAQNRRFAVLTFKTS